jgi:hypothetical protein
VIELKNPADEDATVWSAFNQLQTYQSQIPALFGANAALVASDGRHDSQNQLCPFRRIGDGHESSRFRATKPSNRERARRSR